MERILRCKACGSSAHLETHEIMEDDEGNYTFEVYSVECDNPNCNVSMDREYTEDDAIHVWNTTYGGAMTLEELIQFRGVDKPDYDRQGIPKDNYWSHYYDGWKDAYKDLKEILEQHGFDMKQIII